MSQSKEKTHETEWFVCQSMRSVSSVWRREEEGRVDVETKALKQGWDEGDGLVAVEQ